MTDSRIKGKILRDAKADAEQIMDEARKKAAAIVQQSKKDLEHIRSETEEIARETKQKEIDRRLSAARMKSKRRLLQEKRDVIDNVFGEAKKRLLEIKKQEYIQFITHLIKEEVKIPDATLVLSKNDIKKYGEGVGKLILKASEAKDTVTVEKDNFDGGCIVKHQIYEFNATLDTILSRIKEQKESELQKILFAEHE